jgi:NitT/TauT family transport system substrate-binding protein
MGKSPEESVRSRLATGVAALFGLLTLLSAAGAAKLTIAVGGAGCLCYLPTVLAERLGEYKKAGVDVELVNFKGGSQALTAVIGRSADVVSGYYDHCVNLAARNQQLTAFVVYDRYPGLVLGVSPRHAKEISSVKDLVGKKVGVSAPGSSTDFFLKYLLAKNGVDPDGVAVIGIGLDATAVAAMERGTIDAAVMLDPAATLLKGKFPALKILVDVRGEADTLAVFGGEYPGGALYSRADWIARHEKETQALTDAILATLNGFIPIPQKRSWRRCRTSWSAPTRRSISPHSRTPFRCTRPPAAWTRKARKPCSRCSASPLPKLPRPRSIFPRPTPTALSSNRPRSCGRSSGVGPRRRTDNMNIL